MGTSDRNSCKVVDKTGRRLTFVYRPLSELKLDAANPKDHSRRQVRQIANSIEQFGFITPVVIDVRKCCRWSWANPCRIAPRLDRSRNHSRRPS
jgi:hypothetical protein